MPLLAQQLRRDEAKIIGEVVDFSCRFHIKIIMPTLTFSLTDEDAERIANSVADKLANLLSKHQPEAKFPSPDNRLQVTRVEAARLLGCNPMTVNRLASRGLLHPNRATRRPMYPIKELERFVRECSQPI